MIPTGPAQPPETGSRIGPYVLGEKLGQGGMGAVYRARHADSGAEHALKVLLSVQHMKSKDQVLSRFQRELEVLAQLPPHRGLVRIHLSGVWSGIPWCAMELVAGKSLNDLLANGPLQPREAAALVVKIARTVEDVHRAGIIHRDLKPGNVIIDHLCEPRLVDFGMALDPSSEALSRTGELMGTPAFMAPEQVSRPSRETSEEDFGPTTDVYALGGILFSCLTGSHPFSGHHGPSLLLAVLKTPAPKAHEVNPEVPRDLSAICLQALKKQPHRRYPTALAMAEDLERWLKDDPVLATTASSPAWIRALARQSRQRGFWVAAVALCASLIVTGLALRARPPQAPSIQQQLNALQSRIQKTGLGNASPESITKLLQEAEADQNADVAEQAALLSALVALAQEDSNAELQQLAALVRPGGKLNRPRLRQAERLLASAQRWGAVNQILHAHEPPALVHPSLASDLARALVNGGPWLTPPRDQSCFEALYEAQGLDDGTRGALLLLRAAGQLELGPEGFSRALDNLEQAFVVHGIAAPSLEIPGGFLSHGVEELLALVEASDPRAKTLSNLLCRLDPRHPALTNEQVARLQIASLPASVMARDTTSLLDVEPMRFQVLVPLLERLGRWPIRTDYLRTPDPDQVPHWLQRLTEKELSRPPAKRHLALLTVLAQTLARRDRQLTHQLIAATTEAGARGHWYHLLMGHTLQLLGSPEDALPHLQEGLKLDRLRPADERWPLAAELMAAQRFRDRANPEVLFATARLTLEARETQRAVTPLLENLRASGASAPWVLERSTNIAGLMTQMVMAMLELTTTSCCPGDGPTPDQLIGEALELLDQPFAETVMDISGEVQGTSDTLLLDLRSQHHLKHQRPEQALEALGHALERERGHRPSLVEEEPNWLHRLAALYRSRASLLRQLGRNTAAQADEAEAERLAEKSRRPR